MPAPKSSPNVAAGASAQAIQRSIPEPGTDAPPFELLDQHEALVALKSFLGRRVFVYFYPKAMTSGCTTQAIGLSQIRDRVGDTAIVGISPDPPTRLKKFDEKDQLGFELLSDESTEVAQAYGVWQLKKLYGREYMGVQRSAFLIDEHGKIAKVWPKISPKDTPTELLKALDG